MSSLVSLLKAKRPRGSLLTAKKNPETGSFLYFYKMILNKLKHLLILLVASACLWTEPAYASGNSSDNDPDYWTDLAVFFGSWTGTTTGSVNEYVDVKMGFPFLLDIELQLTRVAIGFYYGFGLIHSLTYLYEEGALTEDDRKSETTDESMGLTLGYAVFNTPYVELQPFIGVGGNYFNNGLDDMVFTTFVAGGNVDIRLGANRVKSTDVAFELGFMLRLKYIAEFGSFSDKFYTGAVSDGSHYSVKVERNGSYINHIFAISLGIAIW